MYYWGAPEMSIAIKSSGSKTQEHSMDTQIQKATVLTVDQAHALIGKENISRGGFYAAINRGEVPHLRLGHRILIPRNAFQHWLESAGNTRPAA
jgi:excisionase family DNA binding protein